MAKTINKSGKRLVKKRTRDGRVRAYWMGKGDEKKTGRALKNAGPEEKRPGFLRRHAGKLLAGAALLGGAALLNKNKLMGAARGAGFVHNAIQHSGEKVGLADRARMAFRGAKAGYLSNRGMDRVDHVGVRGVAKEGLTSGMNRLGSATAGWRQRVGGGLAHHLAGEGGRALLGMGGARLGSMIGTAAGGLFGGPAGAALGSWVFGQAGGYLANAHLGGHVERLAGAVGSRVAGAGHSNTQIEHSGTSASAVTPTAAPSTVVRSPRKMRRVRRSA